MLTLALISFILAFLQTAVTATPVTSLVARGNAADCPYPADRGIDVLLDKRITIKVRFLSAGSNGCTYVLVNGWEFPKGGGRARAVAKTPRKAKGLALERTELKALEGIGELFYKGNERDGRQWAVMQYMDGVPVWQTSAWRRQFPHNYNTMNTAQSIQECEFFMRKLYQKAADKIGSYIEDFEWEPVDTNWRNYLWSDDLSVVNVVDWGLAKQTDPDNVRLKIEKYKKRFEEESSLPIRDTLRREHPVQGICESAMRNQGAPWVNGAIQRAS